MDFICYIINKKENAAGVVCKKIGLKNQRRRGVKLAEILRLTSDFKYGIRIYNELNMVIWEKKPKKFPGLCPYNENKVKAMFFAIEDDQVVIQFWVKTEI